MVSTIIENEKLPVILMCCGYNRCRERSLEDELCAAYILRTLIETSESNAAAMILDDS